MSLLEASAVVIIKLSENYQGGSCFSLSILANLYVALVSTEIRYKLSFTTGRERGGGGVKFESSIGIIPRTGRPYIRYFCLVDHFTRMSYIIILATTVTTAGDHLIMYNKLHVYITFYDQSAKRFS